jgi:hypothetical protein
MIKLKRKIKLTKEPRRKKTIKKNGDQNWNKK